MQDPELQQATASEPLSLESEYEMQQTWAQDSDKCTFILLDRSLTDTPGTGSHGGAMVGDVNLFLNEPDDPHSAEIEIMVAEPASRRRGIAAEAVRLMAAYAQQQLSITKLTAKIGEANTASLALFQRLGFTEVRRIAVFQEVHLQMELQGSSAAQQLLQSAGLLQYGTYDT